MTLHDAIELVLKHYKRPLSAKEVASHINGHNFYQRNDGAPVEAKQILSRVKNYPSVFSTINGQIILVDDRFWKNLLLNYIYLTNLLKGMYNAADVQFILAVLLYFKRCIDAGNKFPEQFLGITSNLNIDKGFENAQSFVYALEDFEKYDVGPEGIFSECSRLLRHLDWQKLGEIFNIVRNLDTSELDHRSFGDAFEYLINLIPDRNRPLLSPTPHSLRELMVSILDPQPHKSLFDPVAGTGGLLIEAKYYVNGKNLSITGAEINLRVAQLGNMNLAMHGIYNIAIKTQDSFEGVNSGVNKRYDYIIADLPISGITSSHGHETLFLNYNLTPTKLRNSFGGMVLLILSSLSDDGKAVLTVSESFLTKKGIEQSIRELLLQQDYIESVVSLPYGTLRPFTDAKASLLVLNKNKDTSLRNKIRFITGRVADQDSGTVYLNNDEILDAYHTDSLLSKDSQVLDISELRPDANLSADAYDGQYFFASLMLKEGSGRPLFDLVTIRAGIVPAKADIDITGDFPLVKIENLSRDILETDLNTDTATRVYVTPKYYRSIISEKCILVARIGEQLKATIFHPDINLPQILIHSGVYALIPKEQHETVDIEYLYYQFHSSFVIEQIKKRKLGAVMPYISIGSLKEIVIPYVDLSSQKKFIESQKANLIFEEENRANAVYKALGRNIVTRQSETEIVKTLTHQLRPKFMEINSLATRIKRIVDNEKIGELMEYNGSEMEDIDPEIEMFKQQPENYSIDKLVDKMIKDSTHLSDVLTIVDKVMNFKLSEDDLIETDLLTFIKQYKDQKDITINHRYEILVKGDAAIALINKTAFTDLLDQLLQNAEDHGFNEESQNKKYRVQFTVRYNKTRQVIVLEYNNNGAPYELQHKDFVNAFEKGRTSTGSGIGGNYINRIVEAHKGQIKVVENNTKGFALTIELPSIKNVSYE